MPNPIRMSGDAVDLSPRFKRTTTVAASPTDATETVIATLTITDDDVIASGIMLRGWAAYTVGTNGVSARLRIRATSVAGTVKGDTGALTAGIAAAALDARSVEGFDTAATLPGQVYVLTLTVGSASAASTVSAVALTVQVI